jgi:hypothetical protein
VRKLLAAAETAPLRVVELELLTGSRKLKPLLAVPFLREIAADHLRVVLERA